MSTPTQQLRVLVVDDLGDEQARAVRAAQRAAQRAG